MLFVGQSFAQILTLKSVGISIDQAQDSIPKVIYINDFSDKDKPMIFIDEEKVHESLLATIDPHQIDSIYVLKSKSPDDGIYDHGEIHFSMKASFKNRVISLFELKNKYIKELNKPCVFTLDGKIIREDETEYLVNESYILKMEIEEVNVKQVHPFIVIKLYTRSEENLEKERRIILR